MKNLKAILIDIDTKITPALLYEVINTSFEDLIKFHFSFGMDIRNMYNLWDEPELCKELSPDDVHPDSVSMYIIEEYWKLKTN